MNAQTSKEQLEMMYEQDLYLRDVAREKGKENAVEFWQNEANRVKEKLDKLKEN